MMQKSSDVVVWCLAAALCLVQSLASSPSYLPCNQTFLMNGEIWNMSACLSLPHNASFAWSYQDGTLVAGYTAQTRSVADRWSGWGINPARRGRMAGSGAFLAWRDFSGNTTVRTFEMSRQQNNGQPLTRPGIRLLTVLNFSAEFTGSDVRIFAAVLYGADSLNLVWNAGPVSSLGVPLPHDNGNDYENYFSTFSLTTRGPGIAPGGKYPYKQLKYNHAIVNAVAWGLLLPVGVIVARYARPFKTADPCWFYSHIFFQVCGYVLGLSGWAVGLRLRSAVNNPDDKRNTHEAIGTTIFVFSTLQVLALVLRPKKAPTATRFWWNVYHHTIGFLAIALGITNIFLGFDLLRHVGLEQSHYKTAFLALFIMLASVAFGLEIVTWAIHLTFRRKRDVNLSA